MTARLILAVAGTTVAAVATVVGAFAALLAWEARDINRNRATAGGQ